MEFSVGILYSLTVIDYLYEHLQKSIFFVGYKIFKNCYVQILLKKDTFL